jgi:hypothetical protein
MCAAPTIVEASASYAGVLGRDVAEAGVDVAHKALAAVVVETARVVDRKRSAALGR